MSRHELIIAGNGKAYISRELRSGEISSERTIIQDDIFVSRFLEFALSKLPPGKNVLKVCISGGEETVGENEVVAEIVIKNQQAILDATDRYYEIKSDTK